MHHRYLACFLLILLWILSNPWPVIFHLVQMLKSNLGNVLQEIFVSSRPQLFDK
ncbi:hypothetical protein ABKV19_003363 [Rosa sericea]